MLGDISASRIKSQLPGLPLLRVKNIDHLGPCRFLAVVDFAQVKEMALNPPAPGVDFFGDAPVTVILAVFEAAMTLQKRLGHIDGSKLYGSGMIPEKRVGLHQTHFEKINTVFSSTCVK
jgi:hypothetical protein